jgi:hypothetical protein
LIFGGIIENYRAFARRNRRPGYHMIGPTSVDYRRGWELLVKASIFAFLTALVVTFPSNSSAAPVVPGLSSKHPLS